MSLSHEALALRVRRLLEAKRYHALEMKDALWACGILFCSVSFFLYECVCDFIRSTHAPLLWITSLRAMICAVFVVFFGVFLYDVVLPNARWWLDAVMKLRAIEREYGSERFQLAIKESCDDA